MTSSCIDLVYLVPVLRRPHRVKPFLDAARASTPGARVVFIPDPDDRPERQAIKSFGGEQLPIAGNYAAKIRAGVEETSEPLIFTAADDLEPRPGWFEAALAHLRGDVEVVGVNDGLLRRREHATHFLMTRAYAETPTIDGEPGPFCQAYAHWYCDDELIATARRRGVYAYAPEAQVLHRHPMGGSAPDDDTYRKGRERARLDRRLFRQREAMWT